jgi:glycosyltransferase involved in cell wall biosynthesis
LKRRGLPHRLVLTGKRTEHWPALEALIAELGIRADVVHPGFLPFDEVMRIYKGADAIVFPTRFEGFGLPVTEAVEFGKKVITSRLEVFDEIGVPRQWQIDFADPDQLAAALALPGPTRLEKPLGTWSQNVKATLDLLRQVAVERKSR